MCVNEEAGVSCQGSFISWELWGWPKGVGNRSKISTTKWGVGASYLS